VSCACAGVAAGVWVRVRVCACVGVFVFALCGFQCCCFPGGRLLRLRPLRCSVVLCSWLLSSLSSAFVFSSCVVSVVVVFSVFGLCGFQLRRCPGCCRLCLRPLRFSVVLRSWLLSSLSSAFAVFSCVVSLVAVFSVFGLCGFRLRRFLGCWLLCLRPLWFPGVVWRSPVGSGRRSP